MKENWLALCLCILTDVSIRDAVNYIKTGRRNWRFNKSIGINEEDKKQIKTVEFPDYKFREVLALRENNVTWDCIAKIYNINASTLRSKLAKYKERAITDEPTKVTSAICSDKKSFTL